ncbi:hypothetical protein [Dendrosporobacter sp. 1207_IL3150]|uniref:hypothetical protein n=1 Tax=Dendrosporobacter sp. 1207_IL3150 TaxID=3084054 RepID=UPI002FD9AFB9
MSKPETYPVIDPSNEPIHAKDNDHHMREPNTGSKKLRNQHHTGERHGEGS